MKVPQRIIDDLGYRNRKNSKIEQLKTEIETGRDYLLSAIKHFKEQKKLLQELETQQKEDQEFIAYLKHLQSQETN